MSNWIYRFAMAALLLCFVVATSFAQSNPAAHSLAVSNYSFTDWPNTSAAGTFPPSMVFHSFLDRIEPFAGSFDQAPNGNWLLAYNLTSGPRVNGDGTAGVSFLQTGSPQTGNCSYVGQALLGLNSLGRADVLVTFTSQVTGAGTRPYVLRLQYRIGSVGAWVDVLKADGDRAEYHSAKTTTTQTISAKLPLACENQALVQLRWIYFQDGTGSGSRPRIRLDDVSVASSAIAGTPTNLTVYSVSPLGPSQNIPFSVVVRSTDAFGAPKSVSSATSVTLSLVTGTGTLSGTLTGTIAAGTSSVTFTNVIYNVAEAGVVFQAARTSGDVLSTGSSPSITTQGAAAYAIITGAQTTGYANAPFNPMTVTVYRTDNMTDVNYQTPITVSRLSGSGSVTGTFTVTPFRGVARFDNLMVNLPGTYTLQVAIPGLPTQTLPLTTIHTNPTLITDIVPQFVQSRTASGTCNSSTNAYPVPVYARVTFAGLQPSSTYRLNVGGAKDAILTSTGGGFNIQYDAKTNTYTYISGKSLDTDGEFSTFSTTASQTSVSLWINLVASTNDAFQEGNQLYWRIALGDNNGRPISLYQLSQTSTVIRLGVAATQATGIADRASQLTAKNYVLLYDNTAGIGRPLSVAIVQAHGATVPGSENFYSQNENKPGAWATFVPNTNMNGVRRIEERNYLTNAVVYSITAADGMWNGVQTNPSDIVAYPGGPGGFQNAIYLETPRITVSTPKQRDTLCAANPATINYVARGVTNVRIEFSRTGGLSWELVDVAPASAGMYAWTVPAVEFSPSCLIRVTGVERTDISGLSGNFVVVSPLSLVTPLKSSNLCLGSYDTLIVFTSGTVRSYEWYKDGVRLDGVTGPVFVIENAGYTTSGVYSCIVRAYGNCGDLVTNNSNVRVALPTKIVNQTFAAPAVLGETATFVVEAENPNDVITYTWYRGQTKLVDNGRIFGSSSNRLEIRNVMISDVSNEYYCVIQGVCGTSTSRVMRLFNSGIYAEFAKSDYNACINDDVTVKAEVYTNPAGEQTFVRWYKDGVALSDGGKYSGTSTSELMIMGVTPGDAGQYEVRTHLVTDQSQSAMATANVVIATTPIITRQPADASVCDGQGASMGTTAAAQGDVMYQWYFNGTAISGANSETYNLTSVTAARAGNYYVVVSTACGNVTSATAVLDVKPATTITTQPPATLSVQVGQPLTITLVATGSGTLQYQWFKDGVEIAGEVAATFAKLAVAARDAGMYACRVRSECGDVMSDTTTLTTPPVVSVYEDAIAGGIVIGKVSPNPTTGSATFNVFIPTKANVIVRIVNAAGIEVVRLENAAAYSQTLQFDLDGSELANGMYMVVTTVNGVNHVQPFVVIK